MKTPKIQVIAFTPNDLKNSKSHAEVVARLVESLIDTLELKPEPGEYLFEIDSEGHYINHSFMDLCGERYGDTTFSEILSRCRGGAQGKYILTIAATKITPLPELNKPKTLSPGTDFELPLSTISKDALQYARTQEDWMKCGVATREAEIYKAFLADMGESGVEIRKFSKPHLNLENFLKSVELKSIHKTVLDRAVRAKKKETLRRVTLEGLKEHMSIFARNSKKDIEEKIADLKSESSLGALPLVDAKTFEFLNDEFQNLIVKSYEALDLKPVYDQDGNKVSTEVSRPELLNKIRYSFINEYGQRRLITNLKSSMKLLFSNQLFIEDPIFQELLEDWATFETNSFLQITILVPVTKITMSGELRTFYQEIEIDFNRAPNVKAKLLERIERMAQLKKDNDEIQVYHELASLFENMVEGLEHID